LLRYFRINDPYRLVGLLVLALVLYLPLFIDSPKISYPELKGIIIGEKLNEDQSMYTGLVDNAAPLSAWLNEIIETVCGRSLMARHIIAFVLIFLQAAYVGIMFIMRKVFNENTYIPSLIFSLLFLASYDMLTLSGELAGLTFLLLAMNNLFKEIEFRVQRDETVFNIGLYISLASLFSFAYFIFLFCIMAILLFFTRTTLRKFLLLVFGFLLPHLLVISIGYLNGSLAKLWQFYYASNIGFTRQTYVSLQSLLILSALPLLYFIISVFMLQREARFSKYQTTLFQIMFLWLGFSCVYIFYCKDLRPQNLIVFIPAFAFLFSHFFLVIRRKKYAEMNIWILLVGILTIAYLARYNKINSVNYGALVVPPMANEISILKNKRILILENNLAYLRENKLATPYLNWSLSEETFKNPGYYETITEVYHALKSDPPEVIIDRENLMKPFFERMPEIKTQYLRTGNSYNRITNN
jgi:hypothetical protein